MKGYFVISDISGYTDFLTQSELEHANDIIQSILKNITNTVESPLKISNFQGDAILMYAEAERVLLGQSLVHQIENIYYNFQQHLKSMSYSTTCNCKACENMPSLDLKFFVHYGEYALQEVSGRKELIGPDVILIHRLMKNQVVEQTGRKAYALFTQSAAEELGLTGFCDELLEHTEKVADIGAVKTRVYCLHTAWDKELKSQKKRVVIDPDAPQWVKSEATLPVAPEVLWNYLTMPKYKKIWISLKESTHKSAKGGGYGKGSAYHCAHDVGNLDYVVKDWRPFDYFTVDGIALGKFSYRQMEILKSTKDGTRLTIAVTPLQKNPIQGYFNRRRAKSLQPGFQQLYDSIMITLGDLIREHQAQLSK